MIKNCVLVFLPLFLCVVTCAAQPKKSPPKAEKAAEKPIVGADSDAHGCKGSAGYSWSIVKNDCIRLFESGIRLDPKAKGLEKTLSAFVVFKSDESAGQAELFLPNAKKSILLAQNKKDGAGKWTNANYTLTQWKGMYSLENKKAVLLYQGAAK